MDTRLLEKQIKQVINQGSGYGPEFQPVLHESVAVLKEINSGNFAPDAYFKLGMLLVDLEDHSLALEAFQQAVKHNPNDLQSATYVALLLEQVERIDEAISIYIKISHAAPDNTELVTHILELMYSQDDVGALLKQINEFQKQGYEYASVYDYLSRISFLTGEYSHAVEHIKKAVELEPNNIYFQERLMHFLYKDYKQAEVINFYENNTEPTSINSDVRLIIANSYAETGNRKAARELFARLYREAETKPRRLDILAEIALYHYIIERDYTRAYVMSNWILKRDPNHSKTITNIGIFEGEPEVRLEYRKQAMQHAPGDLSLQLNYALQCLECGVLEEGFKYYNSRIALDMPHLSKLIDKPKDIKGKKLFIWNEQGLGDQFIWSWFFRFLLRDNIRATVQVDPRTLELMELSFPGIEFITDDTLTICSDHSFSNYDGNLLLASLGEYYYQEIYDAQKTFEQGETHIAPHLSANPDRMVKWQQRLNALGPEFTIGVCWRSSVQGNFREMHYLTAEDMVTVFQGLDCRIINLQYSYTQEELAILQSGLGDHFVNFADLDLKDDQNELAALISCCDLVFSAPTAVQALSGVLGKRCFSPVGTWFLGKPFNILQTSCVSVMGPLTVQENIPQYRQAVEEAINNQ